MKLVAKYSPKFHEDLNSFLPDKVKLIKKVYRLVEITLSFPFEGIGHPHPYNSIDKGWARDITSKHRLIYRVNKGIVEFFSCYGHYNDH
jgi:toxin YoeB